MGSVPGPAKAGGAVNSGALPSRTARPVWSINVHKGAHGSGILRGDL